MKLARLTLQAIAVSNMTFESLDEIDKAGSIDDMLTATEKT
jgi:hypothetical protein